MPAHEARKRDRFDPLLVCLHDSARGYSQSKDDPEALQKLIGSVAALFDAELLSSEKDMASDVLVSLIKQAEKDMRQSLAEKLAFRQDLPDSLLHFLAYDDIDAAGPILTRSVLLSDTDLAYVIHSKQSEHWQAIAARTTLSDKIIDQLIARQDEPTLVALLHNEGIELNLDMLRDFIPAVKVSEVVAENFVNYKSLPKEIAVEIYWHVSVALRTAIADRFRVKDGELETALEECVQDFTDTLFRSGDMTPTRLMKETAALYMAKDMINPELLISVLRQRQGRFFIALFSEKTGLVDQVVHSLMKQIGGQGLAVACRAGQIGRKDFVSLFLLSRAIARADHAVNAAELNMALRYYDGLTFKMARDIMEHSIAR